MERVPSVDGERLAGHEARAFRSKKGRRSHEVVGDFEALEALQPDELVMPFRIVARARDPRLRQTRQDAVDADIELAELARRDARDSDDGAFRGNVVEHAGAPRQE